MKFQLFSGTNRPGRRRQPASVVATSETCESRLLLAGVGPDFTKPAFAEIVTSENHEISWSPITNAVSYHLQVSDVETGKVVLEQTALTQTSFSGNLILPQGRVRALVRAKFADNSTTSWSAPNIFTIRFTPQITGPRGTTPKDPWEIAAEPQKLDTEKPALTWKSAPGAKNYEIYLQNLTDKTLKTYTVIGQFDSTSVNLTPRPASGTMTVTLSSSVKTSQISTLFVPTSQTGLFRLSLTSNAVPAQSQPMLARVDAATMQRTLRTLPGYQDVTVSATESVAGITYEINFQKVNAAVTVAVSANTLGVTPVIARTREYSDIVTTQRTVPLPFNSTNLQIQNAIQALPGFASARVLSSTLPGNGVQYKIELRDVNETAVTTATISTTAPGVVSTPQANAVVENSWFEFPAADVPVMSKFQVFLRTTDDGGRTTSWSPGLKFETTQLVKTTSPESITAVQPPLVLFPSIDRTPNITWNAVANATSYQLRVTSPTGPGGRLKFHVNETKITGTSFQVLSNLPDGQYTIWLRAIREVTGNTPAETAQMKVEGNWTPASTFQIGSAIVVPQISTLKSTLNENGDPAVGFFAVSLRSAANGGATYQTRLLRLNSSAGQLQAAIRALPGFSGVTVEAAPGTPGTIYEITFTGVKSAVSMSVTQNSTEGTFETLIKRAVGLRVEGSTNITGPLGSNTAVPGETVVTDAFPTITWDAVDQAVQYELVVNRSGSTIPYVQSFETGTSYQFRGVIPAGSYIAKVRVHGPSGITTDWSPSYEFKATGGVTQFITPANNAAGNALRFTWIEVPDAVSYEMEFRQINPATGANIPGGLTRVVRTTNELQLPNALVPLAAGTYRVWVRAILAGGVGLGWSTPITVTIAATVEPQLSEDQLLVVLADRSANPQQRTATVTASKHAPQSAAQSQQSIPVVRSEAAMPAVDPNVNDAESTTTTDSAVSLYSSVNAPEVSAVGTREDTQPSLADRTELQEFWQSGESVVL